MRQWSMRVKVATVLVGLALTAAACGGTGSRPHKVPVAPTASTSGIGTPGTGAGPKTGIPPTTRLPPTTQGPATG